jgi:hypothetical protein
MKSLLIDEWQGVSDVEAGLVEQTARHVGDQNGGGSEKPCIPPMMREGRNDLLTDTRTTFAISRKNSCGSFGRMADGNQTSRAELCVWQSSYRGRC